MPQQRGIDTYGRGGLAGGTDALFDLLAQRETERLAAEKVAEEMRRQMVKEAADRATAAREDRKLDLDVGKFGLDRDRFGLDTDRFDLDVLKWNNPDLKTADDVMGPNNTRLREFYNPRTGKVERTQEMYREPKYFTWEGMQGPKNTSQKQLFDAYTLKQVMSGVEAPKQGETGSWSQPFTAFNPETQQLGMFTQQSKSGVVRPVTLGGGGGGGGGRLVADTGGGVPGGGGGGGSRLVAGDIGRGTPVKLQPERAGTEAQGKASIYDTLMEEGIKAIEANEPNDNDLVIIQEMSNLYDTAKYALLSPAGQSFINGAKLYLEGTTRGLTGAAINKEEWPNFRSQFIPVATEGPEARAIKVNARRNVMYATAAQSGPMYEKTHGHPFLSNSRADAIASEGTEGDLVRGPDGKLVRKSAAGSTVTRKPAVTFTPQGRGSAPATPAPTAPAPASPAAAAPAARPGDLVRGPDGRLHIAQ